MKVVLFCGGFGMRLRDQSQNTPKPLVRIGYRPIIWHVMNYYAQYGHQDFILCLGYKADEIKRYFLNYEEWLSNDFVFENGGSTLDLLRSDIQDWRITFVDTGLHSNIGMRLKAVESHLAGEEMFLANYSDGLTDLPLDDYLADFQRCNSIAGFVSVKPTQSFHLVNIDQEDRVTNIQHIAETDVWINGGYFVFKNDIFNFIQPGEELVEEPFQRLIAQGELYTYKHRGFWACMDTFKDKQRLEDIYSQGTPPWDPKNGNLYS